MIFTNLVVSGTIKFNHRMHNLYPKLVKILEICKQFSNKFVNEQGNIPRRGPVPNFGSSRNPGAFVKTDGIEC